MKSGPPHQKNRNNAYLKYSGLAFQLAAVVCIGLFAGRWIDTKMQMDKPIFTMLLVMLFFALFLYKLYDDLKKDQ
jgi:ATP synthase protein I